MEFGSSAAPTPNILNDQSKQLTPGKGNLKRTSTPRYESNQSINVDENASFQLNVSAQPSKIGRIQSSGDSINEGGNDSDRECREAGGNRNATQVKMQQQEFSALDMEYEDMKMRSMQLDDVNGKVEGEEENIVSASVQIEGGSSESSQT